MNGKKHCLLALAAVCVVMDCTSPTVSGTEITNGKICRLQVAYDKMTMKASLSWSRLDTGALGGYVVRRSGKTPDTFVAPTDTFFVDDDIDAGDSASYHVYALDRQMREICTSDTVRIAIRSALVLIKTVTADMRGFNTGEMINSVVRDTRGNLYIATKTFYGTGNIYKVDSNGSFLAGYGTVFGDSVSIYMNSIGADAYGNVYGYDCFHIIRFSSDLKRVSEIDLNDTNASHLMTNSTMKVSDDGFVFVVVNNGSQYTKIYRFNSALSVQEYWEIPAFITDLQLGPDSSAANLDPYVPTKIQWFDRSFNPLGTWEVGLAASPYRPDSLNNYESKFYMGQNGVSVLIGTTVTMSFASLNAAVVFFNPDRSFLCRCLPPGLPGSVVSIDKEGNIYWFANRTLKVYRIEK